jgi:pimeloyl-ACP methyl ester carboxylesterase
MNDDFGDPRLSERLRPRTAQTSLGDIEYTDIGSGPVVIALHGAMGGYDQSVILAQTIGEAEYRYIAVSRPGYLGTPINSGKTPEQQADLLVALLDSLSVDRAGVMAVSGGGPAALQFGLKHPDRCCGLVLVSTCSDEVEMPIPFSFKIMKTLARWSWFGRILRRKAEKDLIAVAKRSVRDPEILNRTVNDNTVWPLFSAMLLSTYKKMELRIDGTENDINITRTQTYPLEDLHRPVLVVHGTHDPLVDFHKHVKTYETRLPDVEIAAVDKAEHVAIFTHRDEIRERVRKFMHRNFTT